MTRSPNFTLLCIPILVFGSSAARATVEVQVPDDYETIQEAIDALAANSDVDKIITVARGTYTENLSVSSNITIKGVETAQVLLEPEFVDAPTIAVSDVSNVTIRNLTFIKSDEALDTDVMTGIEIQNSLDVVVASNVFDMGDTSQGISVLDTSTITISNNIFYGLDTAVTRTGDQAIISNNVFADNELALSVDLSGNIVYNLFYSNTTNGTIGLNALLDQDPLFVNVALRDFHLKPGSPAINAGTNTAETEDIIDETRADMGAYGGQYADPLPFPPQGIAVEEVSDQVGSPSMEISWTANQSYLVQTIPGSYRVYYDSDAAGPPYSGTDGSKDGSPAPSPVSITSGALLRLTDLNPPTVVLETPTITAIRPGNQRLAIDWTQVAGATGYIIHYGTSSLTEHSESFGDVGSATLTGLTNGQRYTVAVTATYQPYYYVTVVAMYNALGTDHVSDYSAEKSVAIGDPQESSQSATASAIPEIPQAVPKLPNEGCFIATAAYGSPLAPQVQALRDFRDAVLLKQSWGRAFVSWYYENSPAWAEWLVQHPFWRAATQAVLWPVVVAVLFFLSAGTGVLVVVGTLCFAWICLRYYRKRSSPEWGGGAHV